MGQGCSCAAAALSWALSCPHLARPGLGHLPLGRAMPDSAPSQSCPRVSQRRAFSGSNSWASCYKSQHISFHSAQQERRRGAKQFMERGVEAPGSRSVLPRMSCAILDKSLALAGPQHPCL